MSPSREKPIVWEGIGRGQENWSTVQGQLKFLARPDLTKFQLSDIANDYNEEDDLSREYPEVASQLLQSIRVWQQTLPGKPSGNVFWKHR